MKKYWKLAQPDGWDFYTGKTINYRDNIGKVVSVKGKRKPELCTGTVIHASTKVNDCFIGASIPCSVFRVEGVSVIESDQKCGFKKLKVLKEMKPEKVFKWDYNGVINIIKPFEIKKPRILKRHIDLLHKWDSVRDSVRDSVWDSVRASVRDSVGDSVGDSVWDSVWDSVRDSVGDSVWDSVRDSVRDSVGASVGDSVGAQIGYIFKNNITEWKYIKHKKGVYPYQSTVDLWNEGLVPSCDGNTWRLHGGKNAEILYEEKKK